MKLQAAQVLAQIVKLMNQEEINEYIEKQISNMSKAEKVEQIIETEVCLLGNLAQYYG